MSKLLKTTGIYLFGNVASRIMGIVLSTLATHMLSDTADLGFFRTKSDILILILNIASIQIWMAIIRFIFNFNNVKNKFKVISTGYFMGILAFITYSVAFILFFLVKFIVTKKFSISIFLELYILSFGYVFNQMVQFACRGLGKNRLYVISGIVGSFMQLTFGIVLMGVFKMNSSALFIATAASYISQGMFIEFFLKTIKKIKLKYVSLKLAKNMLRYSIFTALNFASYTFNQRGGNIIVGACLGNSFSGKYSSAATLLSAVGLFVMAFNFAFQEFSFAAYQKSNTKSKIYSNTLNYFVRFIGCGTLILMPLTSIYFSVFVGDSYRTGQKLIPILYIANIFDSVQTFLGSIMQAEKKVKFMFVTQFFGSIVTLLTMIVTLNFLELQSIGISMILCFAVVSLIRLCIIKTKIKVKFYRSFLIHFIPIFMVTTIVYFNVNSILLNMAYCFAATLYFLFCIRKLLKKYKNLIFKKVKIKSNIKTLKG